MSPRRRPTLVYILGTGHCGSTLLDLLLNGHPDILGLGELVSLRRHLHGSSESGRRVLGVAQKVEVRYPPLLEAPFWQDVQRCCMERSGRGLDALEIRHAAWTQVIRWNDSRVDRWGAENLLLVDCIHRVGDADVLTDSSKWGQRLYLLARSGRFDLRVIHLVRDGRAVLSSHVEKDRSFWTAYRSWGGPRLTALALRRRFSDKTWIDVSYEELCRNPRETLETICSFLGLPFSEQTLAYRSHPYVGVGGNRMRVAGRGEEIVLDESWRRRLRPSYRIAFAILGGWIDRVAARRR